MARLKD
ncbi:uncharacterized protein FFB14_09940 [Fusarium fujikuroi]|nr:uncharacterized protein FFB14_09940 [Fusarium fujikuroi]